MAIHVDFWLAHWPSEFWKIVENADGFQTIPTLWKMFEDRADDRRRTLDRATARQGVIGRSAAQNNPLRTLLVFLQLIKRIPYNYVLLLLSTCLPRHSGSLQGAKKTKKKLFFIKNRPQEAPVNAIKGTSRLLRPFFAWNLFLNRILGLKCKVAATFEWKFVFFFYLAVFGHNLTIFIEQFDAWWVKTMRLLGSNFQAYLSVDFSFSEISSCWWLIVMAAAGVFVKMWTWLSRRDPLWLGHPTWLANIARRILSILFKSDQQWSLFLSAITIFFSFCCYYYFNRLKK